MLRCIRCTQGIARLPVEVIVLVGQFLAGQNSLATLASLTIACKLLQQEAAPVLYETVILLDGRGWWGTGTEAESLRNQMSDRLRANLARTR